MKKARKLLAVMLAIMVCLAFGTITAFAQTAAYEGSDGDGAKITITNAAKGETYKVVKLFDATVTGTANGPIAYQGDIPGALSTYFVKDATTGAITITEAGKKNGSDTELSDAAAAALKTWAEAQTTPTKSATSDGTTLEFTNLPYGYYVVLTTQGAGAVTVTNTNPNAEVVDKNTTTPVLSKKVKDADGNWVEMSDANIGQNVQFKVDYSTANWIAPTGSTTQKQVKEYVLGDDFASEKLDFVSIDSVQVVTLNNDGSINEVVDSITVASGATFPITVPWATSTTANGKTTWTSKYANGVTVRVLYTAKLKDSANVDYKDGNVNTADLTWNFTDDTPGHGEGEEHLKDTASVDTYAIALKKFDESGKALDGAVFEFPFYVKSTPDANGNYVYAGTTAGEGLTKLITTPDNGQITVIGVKAGTYSVTETQPPEGYNKAEGSFEITAVKISTTTTVRQTNKSWKIDEDGNVTDLQENETATTVTTYTNNSVAATAIPVINKQGAELPSTGGIGTTIFYILGALLVIGCGIVLIARRRLTAK